MKNKSHRIRRPLMLATSGGAGCLSAIQAIATQLQAQNVELPIHTPVLRKDKIVDELAYGIKMASIIMNAPVVNALARTINFPVIPSMESIEEEIVALEARQKERIYIDFLLDVVESGYVLAAIVNLSAKKTDVSQSRKLVDRQKDFERLQFKRVKAFFLDKLQEAKKNGTPYTEIVTTQMVSMDAICAAVLEYNKSTPEDEPVQVHQYLSDVFTEGAQHYVQSLNRLDKESRSVLHLHGMNLDNTVDNLLETDTKGKFASIEEIDYLNNPMVRQGFKRESLAQYRIGASDKINMPIQDDQGKPTQVAIGAEEKVAAIMLSSVGGESTVDYASLLGQLHTKDKTDFDKIFIFCGKNKTLREHLEQEKKRLQGREAFLEIKKPCEIIILGNQDDEYVANVLTRSDLTLLRGGVVIMEEMALGQNHHAEQRYFFPQIRGNKNNLTTGLPWEDGAINYFIAHLEEKYEIGANIGEVDDLRFMLKPEWRIIDELNSYHRELKGVSANLNGAILSLLEDLIADLTAQYALNTSEQKIRQSVAYKLAMETMKYIDQLNYLIQIDKSPSDVKNEKLKKLITEYDVSCHPIAKTSNFSLGVISIIAASLGIITVGFIIGTLIGLWTGPGALVTGLLGAAGACSALTAGAGIGALIMRNSFFKPVSVEEKSRLVVDCVKQELISGI